MSLTRRIALHRRLTATGLLFLSFFSSQSAQAQVRENWRLPLHFGVPTADSSGMCIAAHPAGGYVVGGLTESAFPSYDPVIVRLDGQGNVMWSRLLHVDLQKEWIAGVVVGAQGEIYASTSSYASGIVRLAKLDGAGNLQWLVQTPQVPGGLVLPDSAHAHLLDAAENTFLGGTHSASLVDSDMIVLSYDANGVQRFATSIDGPLGGDDTLHAICRDTAGNVFVAGVMDGTSTFTKIGYESDFGIAKLSPNGSVQWVRTYDHLGPDWQQMLESIACDSSGNVYGCGRAFRYDTGDNFEVVVSYDTNGQIRWVRDSPYPYGSYAAKRIAVDRWDRVIVLGTALTQFDASGAVNWRVLPQRPASELVVDANGDITIAGLQLMDPRGTRRRTSHNSPPMDPCAGRSSSTEPAQARPCPSWICVSARMDASHSRAGRATSQPPGSTTGSRSSSAISRSRSASATEPRRRVRAAMRARRERKQAASTRARSARSSATPATRRLRTTRSRSRRPT